MASCFMQSLDKLLFHCCWGMLGHVDVVQNTFSDAVLAVEQGSMGARYPGGGISWFGLVFGDILPQPVGLQEH